MSTAVDPTLVEFRFPYHAQSVAAKTLWVTFAGDKKAFVAEPFPPNSVPHSAHHFGQVYFGNVAKEELTR